MSSHKSFIGFLVIFFMFYASSSLADVSVNKDSCSSKLCKKQFKQIRKFARNGSPDAQGILASMYFNGYGTDANNGRGMSWLKKAAKYGGSYYRNQLGMSYIVGEVVDQDVSKGIYWLESSLENNNEQAAYMLGAMYANGKYVDKDLEKAKELLTKSALLGDPNAQFLIGWLYENGQYGDNMLLQAIEFYKAAATYNHKGAQDKLKTLSPKDVVSFPDDPSIERITVTAPPLEDIVTDALDAIEGQGLFSGSGSTGTRLSGRSCIVTKECSFTSGPALSRSVYYGSISATFARIVPPPGG